MKFDIKGQVIPSSTAISWEVIHQAARVIGYGSGTLVGTEQKCHSFKLESLTLKWAFCDHFKELPLLC